MIKPDIIIDMSKSVASTMVIHHLAESLLPQPQNVEVVSYNMDAIVKWDAPLTSLKNLTYTAEYRNVLSTTKEHRCDFGKLPSCHGNYQFRVRIELEGNTSSWAETPNFSLKKGTVIGPPNVTLVTKGGALGAVEVNIQNPVLKISSLKEAYSKVEYNIRYWKKTDKKDRRCTDIFKSLQICLIGFKSRLWLGHSKTFRDLSKSHFCVVLAVCLVSLSCWKVNHHPSLRSSVHWRRFSSRISLFFALFIFPSILTSLQVPATEKHDAATTMLHCRDGARFLPDVTFGIQAKEFNLGFTSPENFVSYGLRVL
uniref:Fibronectin type-III domain-containing protein n=1 Tax=Oncorhynchus mykiss TaxID=8022 RepID=A0A8C7Q253_ONCMY